MRRDIRDSPWPIIIKYRWVIAACWKIKIKKHVFNAKKSLPTFDLLSSYRPRRRNICCTVQVIRPCSVACRVSSPLTGVSTDFGCHCCSQIVKFMAKKTKEIKSQPCLLLFSVTVNKSFRNLNYQIPNKISHISMQFWTSSKTAKVLFK